MGWCTSNGFSSDLIVATFPSYGLDLFLSDLGSCSGLWLGLSVTQALETAGMAVVVRTDMEFVTDARTLSV